MLGSSAATPTRYRMPSSMSLVCDGRMALIDCGEGCQLRLQEAGLSPRRIDYVFVTHLHGDHVLGLPALLQSMTLSQRSEPLVVYGPSGLEQLLKSVLSACGHSPSFAVEFVELRDGLRAELWGGRLKVEAFEVEHTIETYGFSFEEAARPGKVNLEKLRALGLKPGPYLSALKRGEAVVVEGRIIRPEEVLEPPRPGAKIVFSGDTLPCESVVERGRGASVLVHDATFTSDLACEARTKGHSTALDAGRVAEEAGAGLLVLTHFSARYRDASLLVREARRHHKHVIAAEDLMKIVVRM